MTKGTVLVTFAIMILSFQVYCTAAAQQEPIVFTVKPEKNTYHSHRGIGMSVGLLVTISKEIVEEERSVPIVEVISPKGIVSTADLHKLAYVNDTYLLSYTLGIYQNEMGFGGYKIVASYPGKYEAESVFLLKPEYDNSEAHSLIVKTDKRVYSPRPEILVTGRVNGTLPSNAEIILRLINSSGSFYVQELAINENGTFNHTIRGQNATTNEGGYIVRVEAHDEDLKVIKYVGERYIFFFAEETFLNCINGFACKYNFVYDNATYPIIYFGKDRIMNVSLNEEEKSLTLDIGGNSTSMTIALPKDLFQSTGSDKAAEEFSIFADGHKVNYTEVEDTERILYLDRPQETRVLNIYYPENSDAIKIIGTV